MLKTKVWTFKSKCIDKAKNENKFYDMLAIQPAGSLMVLTLSLNGRIGMNGFPRTKDFNSAKDLDKFWRDKRDKGYVVLDSVKEYDEEISARSVEFCIRGALGDHALRLAAEKLSMSQDAVVAYLRGEMGAAEGTGGPNPFETPKKQAPQPALDTTETYGSTWGAFG